MTVTGSIWRAQLTSEQLAVLGRDAGTITNPRPDVLVVGGGILGVAIASAIHDAGLGSVQLIEAGRLGAGATGGATGLLIPEPHQWSDPETFVDLERASLERWRYLDQLTPDGLGLVELDWIGLAPEPAGLAAHQPKNIEWLDAAKIAAIVPGLAWHLGGALIRHQARINPLRALAGLAEGLPAVATGVAATAVVLHGDRVERIDTSAGVISPGAVVFATGQPPVLDGLDGLDIPSDRVKGHLLVTEPTAVRLPCTIAPVATPLEDGRLLAGGTFDYGDESPAVREEVIDMIIASLRAALPGLREAGVSHQWCCFRPRHPDGRPVIDRVPGLANAWLTSGHFRTGILNAPATGMAIARWISADKPPPKAIAWSATRFTKLPH
jgi:glycine/D-amino acid oxidase-like deaminating enzyme